MASLGHLAVGIAAAKLVPHRSLRSRVVWTIGLCVLAMAPDLDVLAFVFRIPYSAEWGHRGATHSLFFSGLLGFTAAIVVAAGRPHFARIAWVCVLVGMSHGVLDSLTDGGKGAALLWPFDDERYFAPVRPLPVAPIAIRFVSLRGLQVLAAELLIFSPLLVWAFWPGRENVTSTSARSESPGSSRRSSP